MNTAREEIYVVNAYERMDGIYVFRSLHGAEEFAAVLDAASVPNRVTRETICFGDDVSRLIAAERDE